MFRPTAPPQKKIPFRGNYVVPKMLQHCACRILYEHAFVGMEPVMRAYADGMHRNFDIVMENTPQGLLKLAEVTG